MFVDAPNVTPLLILNGNQTHAAWRVAVSNACRIGLIPRTYFSFLKGKRTGADIILRLKATLGEKNVRFSVVSETRDRILISASSIRPTSKPQRK